MVAEIRAEHESEWAAMTRVSELLGVGTPETVRKWVRLEQVDAGVRPGITSEESAEVKRLRREVTELAAGAVTCASTLPTATAIPAGSPVSAATPSVSRPATEPKSASGCSIRVVTKSANSGLSAAKNSGPGVVAVLENPLVPGGAPVTGLGSGQLPDDPVGALDPPLRGRPHLGILLQHLQCLRELPFS